MFLVIILTVLLFFSVSVVWHILSLFLLFSHYFCTSLENTVLVYSFSFHPMPRLPSLTFFSHIFPVNPCPNVFNSDLKKIVIDSLMGQTELKDPQSTCIFSTSADMCIGFYSLNYCNFLISLILYSLSIFKYLQIRLNCQLNWALPFLLQFHF